MRGLASERRLLVLDRCRVRCVEGAGRLLINWRAARMRDDEGAHAICTEEVLVRLAAGWQRGQHDDSGRRLDGIRS